MSEFDFGALRDPDAPQPDSHHRDGVETRARELHARSRRNRAIVSGLALVVVIAGVGGIVVTRPDPDGTLTVTDPSSTTVPAPSSSVDGRFVPPTTTEDGLVVLPVTLADGKTFTLRYPPEMRIAQLGFAGGVGVNWPVETGALHCCGKQIRITYETVAQVYGDAKPVHVYRGAHGEAVDYFHGSQAVPPIPNPIDYLVFQFGPWLVQVYDVQHPGDFELRMTDAQRATWARSLTGTVDANGYLLLHAQAPLSIDHDFGGLFGAPVAGANQLQIGENLVCGPLGSDQGVRRRLVQGDGTPSVSWCDGDLHFLAEGSKQFVDLVADRLEVIGASTTPVTTTTTTPKPITPRHAVSASFVSAGHGWMLEQSGDVVVTTDGGVTWEAAGSLGRSGSSMKIRFADANRGFAIPTDESNQTAPLVTDDGGTTWTTLSLPFSGRVFDLAISSGVMYVSNFDESTTAFRIWSTPADHLDWKEDPIQIPVGGGPVPTIQMTFSGGRGWLVEVDRVVVAGAQMATDGTWSAWTPPCTDSNGAAYLSASTGTDLVVGCEESAFSPAGTSAVATYFSHDGGKNYARKFGLAGPVAAATRDIAVVANGKALERTNDGGGTWHFVYTKDLSSTAQAIDLGFTTTTQGFVIFDTGEMIMTYDAGATWSQVTSP